MVTQNLDRQYLESLPNEKQLLVISDAIESFQLGGQDAVELILSLQPGQAARVEGQHDGHFQVRHAQDLITALLAHPQSEAPAYEQLCANVFAVLDRVAQEIPQTCMGLGMRSAGQVASFCKPANAYYILTSAQLAGSIGFETHERDITRVRRDENQALSPAVPQPLEIDEISRIIRVLRTLGQRHDHYIDVGLPPV